MGIKEILEHPFFQISSPDSLQRSFKKPGADLSLLHRHQLHLVIRGDSPFHPKQILHAHIHSWYAGNSTATTLVPKKRRLHLRHGPSLRHLSAARPGDRHVDQISSRAVQLGPRGAWLSEPPRCKRRAGISRQHTLGIHDGLQRFEHVFQVLSAMSPPRHNHRRQVLPAAQPLQLHPKIRVEQKLHYHPSLQESTQHVLHDELGCHPHPPGM
mmetsp:Transcript_15578/g.37428  ORF Transcript_15578/g.37428 Transcript_15578/m.37428 type:complete len:212 (+) Transcript_15578:1397-2032(+)